ncbi:hypothetical protein C8R42DRAFT_39873 [Lentinula raphanica]|nr:hypothetical protein C8R42DRAFT_39873 [Lentinula raphanica]
MFMTKCSLMQSDTSSRCLYLIRCFPSFFFRRCWPATKNQIPLTLHIPSHLRLFMMHLHALVACLLFMTTSVKGVPCHRKCLESLLSLQTSSHCRLIHARFMPVANARWTTKKPAHELEARIISTEATYAKQFPHGISANIEAMLVPVIPHLVETLRKDHGVTFVRPPIHIPVIGVEPGLGPLHLNKQPTHGDVSFSIAFSGSEGDAAVEGCIKNWCLPVSYYSGRLVRSAKLTGEIYKNYPREEVLARFENGKRIFPLYDHEKPRA